ncbi:MAG: Rab family GTPase [Promethearchaeota archaeon]
MYDAEFKIVLFGDPEVAKANLAKKFLTDLFVSGTKMTIGVDFEVKSIFVEDKRVKLKIWDFSGEERHRFLLPTYVSGAKGGLFMYDITNYASIAHIDDWLSIIRKEIRPGYEFPIMAVGIKSGVMKDRQVSAEEGMEIARSRGLDGFIECSVETGENVEEVFEELIRLMINRSFI